MKPLLGALAKEFQRLQVKLIIFLESGVTNIHVPKNVINDLST